jgi:hypothetical protein
MTFPSDVVIRYSSDDQGSLPDGVHLFIVAAFKDGNIVKRLARDPVSPSWRLDENIKG